MLCHHFRARNEIVICVALSSITTLLLFDNQTSHSRFKISMQITNETIAISFAIRIYTSFYNARSWSFKTKCRCNINIISRSCIARLQICCRTSIFSTKYLWFWIIILRKSCSLCRATIAMRSLTRTFNNVFFDRVFVNWFCDKICEFVTKSQISSS